MQDKKRLTSLGIIVVANIFLVSASSLYPSVCDPLIGMVVGLPLIVCLSYSLMKWFDSFSFILIIFICSHFRFYENFWNLIFLGTYLLFNLKEILAIKQKSLFIVIFKLLFFANLVGLVANESSSFNEKILGFSIFCSYFLVFYLIINYDFDFNDVKRFFKVIAYIVFYQLFISIFQKLNTTGLSLPFLPLSSTYDQAAGNLSTSRILGSFGDFELLAEYAAFLFVILLSILFYKRINFLVPQSVHITMLISLFILILLTGTRSSLFVVGIALAILLITHLRTLINMRLWAVVVILYLGFNYMNKLGDPLGLQLVFSRVSEMDFTSKNNQSSDEFINRDVTFEYAYKRLAQHSWIIGEGYTTAEGYRKSLFGSEIENVEIRDYHSLYLSIPIFFGWTGSIVLVILFVSTLLLYARRIFIVPKGSLAFYISLGFFLSWLLLFINEYKIQFIRFPNYFFLIWFWMAISINFSIKFRNEDYNTG